jgi:hypothetical protein
MSEYISNECFGGEYIKIFDDPSIPIPFGKRAMTGDITCALKMTKSQGLQQIFIFHLH